MEVKIHNGKVKKVIHVTFLPSFSGSKAEWCVIQVVLFLEPLKEVKTDERFLECHQLRLLWILWEVVIDVIIANFSQR